MSRTFVNPEMYKGHPIKVVSWDGPPAMEPGAPDPVMRAIGDNLYLAYLCHNPEFPGWDKGAAPDHPGFESYCALLKFEGLSEHYIGPPNDEALHLHPLYAAGLGPYGFWEIEHSPKAVETLRHWVITFHDQTAEIVSRSAFIANSKIPGENTDSIIASLPNLSFNPDAASTGSSLRPSS